MDKEKAIKAAAIVIGFIISALVLWFGFRLLEQRSGRASANISDVLCEAQSATSYAVTFNQGSSKEAQIQYGLSPTSLTQIAPVDCSSIKCTAPITLIPEGSTVYFKIVSGGTVIGNGTPGDADAPPFACSGIEDEVDNKGGVNITTPKPKPTKEEEVLSTPTPTIDVCRQIRNSYSKWSASCVREYNAVDCARCMPQDTSSDSK